MKDKFNKQQSRPSARRFQFEATMEMADGIEKAVDASRRSGLKLTASHVCRLAMSQYLVSNGFMENP